MLLNGYIYLFVQIDEFGAETYKLGFTKNNPTFRLKQLSTGNPNEIRLLNFYESENYQKIEHWLHKKFHNTQTLSENEWFNLPQEFILNFKEECKKIDDVISLLKKENHFYK